MVCLKCGRDLEEGHAFCPTCLEMMRTYPVKPGTPIQLPPKQAVPSTKPRRKKQRERKPEDEVRRLQHANRWLILVLVVLLLAFVLVSVFLLILLQQREMPLPL